MSSFKISIDLFDATDTGMRVSHGESRRRVQCHCPVSMPIVTSLGHGDERSLKVAEQ